MTLAASQPRRYLPQQWRAASGTDGEQQPEQQQTKAPPPPQQPQPPPAAARAPQAEDPSVVRGQGTAIVTGAISIIFGVLYLALVQFMDMRGGELLPPPPEAYEQQ